MLTNKSIAIELGFEKLYGLFKSRYLQVKEEMEKKLNILQLLDLVELHESYDGKYNNVNFIFTRLKQALK